MIIASAGTQREFHLVPAGTHQGVCYAIWDVGLQKTTFQGKDKIQHKVIVSFEVQELIPTGEYQGKRMTISKRYTLSLSDKANLRKDLEGWRGRAFTETELKGFDIEKLIGVNCMLSVVHNTTGDRTYANTSSISKLMKGLEPMIPENGTDAPEWIKKVREKAVDPEAEEPEAAVEDDGGDVPF